MATSSGALSLHLGVPLMFTPNLLVCLFRFQVSRPAHWASLQASLWEPLRNTLSAHSAWSGLRRLAHRDLPLRWCSICTGVGYLIRGFSSWNSSVHWKERAKHSQNLRYPTKNPWHCLWRQCYQLHCKTSFSATTAHRIVIREEWLSLCWRSSADLFSQILLWRKRPRVAKGKQLRKDQTPEKCRKLHCSREV